MTQFVNVSFFCVPVHEDTTILTDVRNPLLEPYPHGRNFQSGVEKINEDCVFWPNVDENAFML